MNVGTYAGGGGGGYILRLLLMLLVPIQSFLAGVRGKGVGVGAYSKLGAY